MHGYDGAQWQPAILIAGITFACRTVDRFAADHRIGTIIFVGIRLFCGSRTSSDWTDQEKGTWMSDPSASQDSQGIPLIFTVVGIVFTAVIAVLGLPWILAALLGVLAATVFLVLIGLVFSLFDKETRDTEQLSAEQQQARRLARRANASKVFGWILISIAALLVLGIVGQLTTNPEDQKSADIVNAIVSGAIAVALAFGGWRLLLRAKRLAAEQDSSTGNGQYATKDS